ncbi:MAG: hypothetical protein HZC54_21460 [Verrucomicrobia bacterium]|nr:hypothetical protein [Verrucomicrobiota bacterium]
MRINARTLEELTPAEAAYLQIPLYGQAIYGQAVYMSRAEAQRRLDEALRRQEQSRTMSNENLISATMTAEQKTTAIGKLQESRAAIPVLANMRPEDKVGFQIVGNARAGMDETVLRLMEAYPKFMPGWTTLQEVKDDQKYRFDLLEILAEHTTYGDALRDTITMASHDNYGVYRAFYDNVKSAAKRGVADADAILPELAVYFERISLGMARAAAARAAAAAANTQPGA